jgi:hypothetical protein
MSKIASREGLDWTLTLKHPCYLELAPLCHPTKVWLRIALDCLMQLVHTCLTSELALAGLLNTASQSLALVSLYPRFKSKLTALILR